MQHYHNLSRIQLANGTDKLKSCKKPRRITQRIVTNHYNGNNRLEILQAKTCNVNTGETQYFNSVIKCFTWNPLQKHKFQHVTVNTDAESWKHNVTTQQSHSKIPIDFRGSEFWRIFFLEVISSGSSFVTFHLVDRPAAGRTPTHAVNDTILTITCQHADTLYKEIKTCK